MLRVAGELPADLIVMATHGLGGFDASKRALEHALSLARQSAGRLVLVHVLEDVSAEEPRFACHFNMEECWAPSSRRYARATRPWCLQMRAGSLEIEVRVPFGKAYRELLGVAAECRADMIVLGSTGWSAPFGATTQHVVRGACARC